MVYVILNPFSSQFFFFFSFLFFFPFLLLSIYFLSPCSNLLTFLPYYISPSFPFPFLFFSFFLLFFFPSYIYFFLFLSSYFWSPLYFYSSGGWAALMDLMSSLGIVCSVAIICFSSSEFAEYSFYYKCVIFLLSQQLLLCLKFLIQLNLPGDPQWVRELAARNEYIRCY